MGNLPYGKSSYTLYEDDGETTKYLEGEVAETTVNCEEAGNIITISISARKGSYENMSNDRTHDLLVHLDSKPTQLSGNHTWWYDEETSILHITGIKEQDEFVVVEIGI